MTHTLRQHLRHGASIVLVLLFLVPAAHAQGTFEPWAFLKDAKFKPLYIKALGPKSKTPWLAKMDGPAPTPRKVTVDGTEYVLTAFCKNRDCGDNSAVLLYSAPKEAVYGTIYEKGKTTLIGDPPPAVAAELPKLWKLEWRSQPK